MTEQPLIPFYGTPAGVEFVGKFVHPPHCTCGQGVCNRKQMKAIRDEQLADRCDAEESENDARVRMYAERYEQNLGLFEDVEVYEQVI